MKSTDVVDKFADPSLETTWLDKLARHLVVRTLENLTEGHLTIQENGEVLTFGQAREEAGVVAHIHVEHPCAYRYVLLNGTVGSGEAYMLGAWRSPDLVQVIRIFVLNMQAIQHMDSRWSIVNSCLASIAHKFAKNTRKGSQENIAAHYDLGNDFFSLFLDETMLYSAAIYPDEKATLTEASKNKMRHICERLQLSAEDHLLEIGTGWGGMAIYAAKHYGCRVTTATISQEQFDFAKEWVKREGLQELVTVLLKDYRDLEGCYDKLLSIEMIEAVGYKFYRQYFSICSRLLKEDGLMLIQAITIQDQRYELEKNNVDFIQRYIFPGGSLPSIEVIARHLAHNTDMQLIGLEDITFHYAKTLADWKRRFFTKLDEVKQQGFDDVFIRMWDFYLSYCEGGFAERVISTSQFLVAKPRRMTLPKIG